MNAASWRITLVFVLVELIGVGGLGAWAASRLGFDYAWLSPLSFLIYLLAGLFTARAGGSGAIAAGIVAFLDSLTWAAFGGLGPQPTIPSAGLGAKAITVAFVTAGGVLLGLLGARLGRRRSARAA